MVLNIFIFVTILYLFVFIFHFFIKSRIATFLPPLLAFLYIVIMQLLFNSSFGLFQNRSFGIGMDYALALFFLLWVVTFVVTLIISVIRFFLQNKSDSV